MTAPDFLNRLRTLSGLDMRDLVEGGAIGGDDVAAWARFRDDPVRWLVRAAPGPQAAVCALVEARQVRRAA